MKKILAFTGSNSTNSLNHKLLKYASSLIKNNEVNVIDLNDYNAPMYSIQLQKENGFPEEIIKLNELIQEYNAFIVAVPEHNGMMPAFFKNIMDWLSRLDRKLFHGKPILLLSTSPGKSGGSRGLKILELFIGYFAGSVAGTFSLPNFNENFDTVSNQIKDKTKNTELTELLEAFDTDIELKKVG